MNKVASFDADRVVEVGQGHTDIPTFFFPTRLGYNDLVRKFIEQNTKRIKPYLDLRPFEIDQQLF